MSLAFADESVRIISIQPMYLLGATIFEDEFDSNIGKLCELKKPSAPKLHWREMGRSAQALSLQVIAGANAVTVVIIAAPVNPRKQERARRKCMEALLPILEKDGIDELIMESRNDVLDARDREMVSAMKAKGLLNSIMVNHRRGETDPRLWFPDLVLGAYGDIFSESDCPKQWVEAWTDVEKKTILHVIEP